MSNQDHPQGAFETDGHPSNDVEQLVAHYVERMTEGELLDPDEIRGNHPDVANTLLATLELFVDAGPDGNDTPPLGTLGDYTLRRQIGRGGMGVVYEAWEGSMDRAVALKVLPAGVAADDRAFQRFMQEAKTAGKLSHANIVPVFFTGMKEQTPFYAMEYVEGETLAQVLGRLKKTEPESDTPFGKKDEVAYFHNMARAFADVADGLQHAHSNGVVHRDIKPSNLILDQEGRLRILDFGLARLEGQESLTMSGDFLGTLAYMSPEQAKRRKIPVDHRTDIYSLGATLYELLTHQQPFRGSDHNDTLSQIIERDPRPPRQLNSRVPQDLETIVLKCLRKDAGDRYGTAEALGQDLRRFVRGDAIEARSQPGWERIARKAARNKNRLFTYAGVLSFLAVCGLLVHKQLAERRERNQRAGTELVAQAVPYVHLGLTGNVGVGKTSRNTRHKLFFQSDSQVLATNSELGPLRRAVATLEQAAKILPDKPDAYYHWARALWFTGDPNESLNVLTAALHADPEFLPALALRTAILNEQSSAGEPEVALPRKIQRGSWPDVWFRAHQASTEGDWQTAIDDYSALIQIERVSGEPYVGSSFETRIGLGIARLESEDLLGAIGEFSIAKDDWPGAIVPSLLLGKTYRHMRRYDEAEAIFQDLFEQTEFRDSVAYEIACFYASFWEFRRALEWFSQMRPSAVGQRARAYCLIKRGDFQEAAQAAKHARDYGGDSPLTLAILAIALSGIEEHREQAVIAIDAAQAIANEDDVVYQFLAQAFFEQGKFREAADMARKAVDLNPDDSENLNTLSKYLGVLGRLGDALPLALRAATMDPENFVAIGNVGLDYRIKGDLRASVRWLRKSLERHPADAWTYGQLSRTFELEGDTAQAIENFCKSLALSLTSGGDISHHRHRRLAHLLLRRGSNDTVTALDQLVPPLEEALAAGNEKPLLLHTAALASSYGSSRDATSALDYARRAVEQSRSDDPDLLLTLADLLFAADRREVALLNLEKALQLPGVTTFAHRRFEEYCREAYPRLPGHRSLECALGWQRDVLQDDVLLKEYSASMGSTHPQLVRYLQGRVLQRSARHVEAVEAFSQLVSLPQDRQVAPYLRLAESLRDSGRAPAAARCLRQALEGGLAENRHLWNLWLDVSWNALGRPSGEMLVDLPQADSKGPTTHRYVDDIRWLLRQLASGESVRLNCGGSEYEDASHGTWGADRFFRSGRRYPHWKRQTKGVFAGEINDTDDDYLYKTERWFLRDQYRPGYRIPLPDGTYRIVLHFAEVWYHAPRLRLFDVLVEGEKILTDQDIFGSVGFARPEVKPLTVPLEDGVLDLEFESQVDQPKISAIEIIPLNE